MRKISSEGLALIKQWEGLRLNAYKDAIGVWTIGYGHTNSAGKPFIYEGMTITEKQTEKALKAATTRLEVENEINQKSDADVRTALSDWLRDK
ncbi:MULTISPECIES: lysozyme [unclassified Bartonella]|uniref:lysozyme n=1 Tax=unclassified Bartonella TaxID=2645622 RepID=UPI0035CF8507